MTKDVPGNIKESTHLTVGIILLCISVIGTCINAPVLYVYIKKKLLNKSNNILTFALFTSGLVMGIAGIPFATASSFSMKWTFGHSGCVYYGFISNICAFLCITLLTSLVIERYIVIVGRNVRISTRCGKGMLIGCLSISMVAALCPIFGWSSYTLEAMRTSCSLNWQSNCVEYTSYNITILIAMYAVPLIIISFSYLKIFRAVQLQVFALRNFHQTAVSTGREKDLAKTVLLMTVAFLLSWTPYMIVSVWIMTSNTGEIHPFLAIVPAIMTKLFIIWNPFIYLDRNIEFRKSFFSVFPCASRFYTNPILGREVPRNTYNIQIRSVTSTDRRPTDSTDPETSTYRGFI